MGKRVTPLQFPVIKGGLQGGLSRRALEQRAGSFSIAQSRRVRGTDFTEGMQPSLEDSKAQNPESILSSLYNLQFDVQRTLAVKDLNLHYEGISITFDRGEMIFLKPIEGVVTGLYFWGTGTVLVIPSSKIEKQQLNLFTGAPILNERFGEAFIRFTDDTYARLVEQSDSYTEADEPRLNFPADKLQFLLKASALTNYRVLADLMNGLKTPMFSARIVGQKLGTFDFSYDQRKTEEVCLGQLHPREGGSFSYDTWCSFSIHNGPRGSSERTRRDASDLLQDQRLIDARHYEVETQIERNDKITGRTKIEFVAEREGEWVLTFDLSRLLKVSQVVDESQRPLTFFQNGDISDGEVSKLGHDVILVVLNEPLHSGQLKTLQFSYAGDVMSRVGNGVFYVGPRGSWYPNTGYSDRAKYGLSFRYPRAFTIVATGDLVKEWEEAGQKRSLWVSNIDIPVAGFNYGDYIKKTSQADQIPVEVYANRGIENIYLEVMARLEMLRELYRHKEFAPPRRGEIITEPVFAEPNFTDFDTTRFADEIANRVASTLLFFEALWGKYPYGKLAVSQIPGQFSQGWPSLLYVSGLAFLSPEQRVRLGMEKEREASFLECLPAHEIAHQWWGNQVGWKSYHDLWMMEGFSNYFGYLSMKSRYPTPRKFSDLMRCSRERLLAKNVHGQTNESAGPVWLGTRLFSSKFPAGYLTVVYEKGAWVLHMLRYLMSDPNTGSDQNFQRLIQDFSAAFRGKLASTEDFKQMVEKSMNKDLDLEGNRKMDWFFDQWVYGTGIPTYRMDYSITALKDRTFLLKGKIFQENVSEYFIMPVEVFGHYTPGKIQRLGRVVVSGNQANFRFILKSKPLKVTLDENNEILCENKTV
jgi:Peptidase family M1 domain